MAIEIAEILGEKEDACTFTKIYKDAKRDIIKSLNENYACEGEDVYIPSTPSKGESSMFGCLFGAYPAKFLSYDNELIQKTIKYIYIKRVSVRAVFQSAKGRSLGRDGS